MNNFEKKKKTQKLHAHLNIRIKKVYRNELIFLYFSLSLSLSIKRKNKKNTIFSEI
jgi:hypothetical protein